MSQGRPDEDLGRFCCLSRGCPDYGKRGAGNLSVPMRYGPQRRRLLRCKTCKARFSDRKGTPLFDSRLPHAWALAVLRHLADGCGARQTGRLVGVDKDTAARYGLRAGGHAARLARRAGGLFPPDSQGPAR